MVDLNGLTKDELIIVVKFKDEEIQRLRDEIAIFQELVEEIKK